MDQVKRLLLLVNPCAGVKKGNRYLSDIIRLCNERGYECVTYVTGYSGDATRYLMKCAPDSFDRVICIGGDGTLNETVTGLVESGLNCPVGYIPAGTTNDYAGSLGLSTDILQATRDALDGVTFEFDVGLFNGSTFIYTASCGAFARTSYTTPQAAKNILGHLAYILEGISELPSIKPIHMRLCAEDRKIEGDFLFAAVTNSISVGGVLKLDPTMVCLNDGLFEVLLVHELTTPAEWSRALFSLRTSDIPNDVIEFFTAKELKIETEDPVEWTFDGEQGAQGCVFEVKNLCRRMRLVLPHHAAESVPAEPVRGDAP